MSSTPLSHCKERPKNNLELDFGVFGFGNHRHPPNPPLRLLWGLWVVALILGLGCVFWLAVHCVLCPPPCYPGLVTEVGPGLRCAGRWAGRGRGYSTETMAEGLQARSVPFTLIANTQTLSRVSVVCEVGMLFPGFFALLLS